MPLTKPAARDHIHTRDVRCRGFKRADGMWDVEATLEDTKTYSFANHDRAGINSGEPIHHMHIRLTVDDDLVVQAAEAHTEASPFTVCPGMNPVFDALVGLRVGPGWRRAVTKRMGGPSGCTHLTDLLLGPVTTTVLQTVGPARSRRQSASPAGGKPPLLDSCHAFSSDSPVAKREWPDHYTGEE